MRPSRPFGKPALFDKLTEQEATDMRGALAIKSKLDNLVFVLQEAERIGCLKPDQVARLRQFEAALADPEW